MKTPYLFAVGPILAGLIGWIMAGDWQLGLIVFVACAVGNLFAYWSSR